MPTPGEWFFYAGIVGLAASAIAAAITALVLKGSNKRLREKFNKELGIKIK
jgi:hypothetical protein